MRTILITGASGGLAQAMVPLLKDDFLILLGRNREKIMELYTYHEKKAVYDVDIRDEVALTAFLDELDGQHGQIDILVNNAGYAVYDDFENFSSQQVQDMFDINTFSLMTLCRLVGKRMKARRSGHIINIVSMSGLIASAKSSVYSATKFAAIGFSNTIRLELAKYGVAVTTVNPGPIATGFFDQADPDGSYQESVKAFLLQPDYVAKKIVAAMGTKKRDVNLPWTLAAAHKLYTLFPQIADYLAGTIFFLK
ncbi:SDR family NAD(P)-dependent oxidoreductase [Streptococcus ruminantium]|uniref:SDR family oxidoreductase n=1 Tax=Streptococcus ruminantium TaxID=1917441 RepID=A0ABU1B6R5_9STRE|nr:SDR family oxidoreductase [Streptococcus ruminantium]MDQ8759916.1 SDR family oxidoreductase [Streptococcus ruminantium]MDQ8764543.1 SDR family oxidoreductase [Streptococcus ruminantium]MDQ8766989.1 SDR family oxidoreductase [Streptococcus ruminantium]MDQ8769662.1 SDR family oxidoreductase [Streptococcus ruminantium]MDQ8775043.1 SDR family oxidoreductase [Streptococcus ruminantium]